MKVVANSSVTLPLVDAQIQSHKFSLYGLSFLLTTPSHFAKVIVPVGPTDVSKDEIGIIHWLTDRGVKDPNSQEILLQFIDQFNSTVAPTATTFRDSLLSTFGIDTSIAAYVGPICPNEDDSKKIMEAMVARDQASPASPASSSVAA